MRDTSKSFVSSFAIFLVVFFFFITLPSVGQINDTEIDISQKPFYSSLSKALRNADKVYKLDLSKKGLTEFPFEILQLKELRVLVLDSNQITIIPDQIKELQKLEYLSLTGNAIQELPPGVGDLIQLQYLYLDHNKIAALPAILKFYNLQELFINDNKLNEIPSGIKVLKELERLIASNNQLKSIPDEIGYLYNLERLSFANNHIKDLPEHFYELTNLTHLYLSGNELKKIDEGISKLKKIKLLDLSENKLKGLPPELSELSELQDLYLEKNEIDTLPPEISDVFKLRILFIGDNPIKEIPSVYNHLSNLKRIDIRNLAFRSFPQVLYDLNNNDVQVTGLATKELYNSKLLLSQARNKKLTENYSDAILKYEALIRLDTNNAAAISELAAIFLEKTEYDKAASLCKRALSKNASQKVIDDLRITYSNSLNKTNKYEQVIVSYKEKIRTDPANVASYFELGKFYYDQMKYDEAKEVLGQAIQIDPSHTDSHFYLAVMFLMDKQKELFVFSALHVFMLEPNSKKTRTMLPFLLSKMNMRTGVKGKSGHTSYYDSYIIRNESNEIVYKSEMPQADLMAAMFSDILKSGLFSTKDSSGTELTPEEKEAVETALHVKQDNLEIFQLELKSICETNKDSINEREKKFWDNYLPYYSDLIASGHLETFSYIINNIRGDDEKYSKWLKNNVAKVEKFTAWHKNAALPNKVGK
jgi:leucine-rich repeat protein SHOC2